MANRRETCGFVSGKCVQLGGGGRRGGSGVIRLLRIADVIWIGRVMLRETVRDFLRGEGSGNEGILGAKCAC